MNDDEIRVVSAMAKYGGSFVKALAELCWRADPINLTKIKRAWPEYWAEYETIADKDPDAYTA